MYKSTHESIHVYFGLQQVSLDGKGRPYAVLYRYFLIFWILSDGIETGKWRRVVNGFRTHAPDCLLIVQHKINYTSSRIVKRLAA